jgi:MFS superfamily sulfate permease-like transporter
MASTFGPRLWGRSTQSVPAARSLGRRMSWHAAAALMAFATLQIWLVSSAVSAGAPSAFTVIALIMLIALAVPLARRTERHWYHLSRQALASWGLHARFRRDVRRLWLAALAIPFLWVSGAVVAVQAIATIAG